MSDERKSGAEQAVEEANRFIDLLTKAHWRMDRMGYRPAKPIGIEQWRVWADAVDRDGAA